MADSLSFISLGFISFYNSTFKYNKNLPFNITESRKTIFFLKSGDFGDFGNFGGFGDFGG